MRKILFFITILFTGANAFAQQHYRAVETGLYKNDKIVNGVKFYSINGDTAKLLQYKKGQILIDSSSKHTRILFLYEGRKMIFHVIPDSVFYIKITIEGEDSFIISTGLESDEIAKPSNKKFHLIN